jgi:hypothetical protein
MDHPWFLLTEPVEHNHECLPIPSKIASSYNTICVIQRDNLHAQAFL